MTRDPRTDPRPGDRWRDAWGVRTVREVIPEADTIVMNDDALASFADFRWLPAGGRWRWVGERSEVENDGPARA